LPRSPMAATAGPGFTRFPPSTGRARALS
jgi:hypothetical protein